MLRTRLRLCLSVRPNRCRNWYSSLAFEKEEAEFANRKQKVKNGHDFYYPILSKVRPEGMNPMRINEFRSQFAQYKWPDSKRIDEEYVLEGRISNIRESGKGMIFIDLVQDSQKIQLVLMNKLMKLSKDEFAQYHDVFKRGDHVIAKGFPGITNTGELSLKISSKLIMASSILHPIPPKLQDSEKRHHNRVVDYLVNKKSKDVIIARSLIIKSLRKFLENRDFIEVETPIIASNTKGANATPFVTSSKHIKDSDNKELPLQLRVAPELWLKRLIIGGFDKVFEIGKVFRNEGIDGTHNPEFTTCEFYQTFTTLEELMDMTEDLFKFICQEMMKFEITSKQAQELSTMTFQRLEFIPSIEECTKIPFPQDITQESLIEYFQTIQLPLPKTHSIPQLLDKLSSQFLEPQCNKRPTFIFHQPSLMSPLSKSTMINYHNISHEVSRRFELFINGAEYVNAYEEENSPFEQEGKFQLQQEWKDTFHDDESLVPDYKYLSAMEYGLPPTGGWGLGVDRLCMLLCEEKRIEEVLSFGTLPDVVRQ